MHKKERRKIQIIQRFEAYDELTAKRRAEQGILKWMIGDDNAKRRHVVTSSPEKGTVNVESHNYII